MVNISLSKALAVVAFALTLLSLFTAVPLWVGLLVLCVAVILE